jgi:hypothetical protein
MCLKNNCEVIILSNDDLIIDKTFLHILIEAEKAEKQKKMAYFGSLTNNPGPSECNKGQFSHNPVNGHSFINKYKNKYTNLNGFLMVFPKHVLLKNMFDEKHYFDPKFPFGGNETEWFNRFVNIKGIPIVVPKTFVYHYKFARWKKKHNSANKVCIYTVNTGSYEKNTIYISKKNIDILYFTDNHELIYKCSELGIYPFYVIPTNDPKLLQRTIKTSPHIYIPNNYEISIYIDGNMKPKDILYKLDFNKFMCSNDIICFHHPSRTTINDEIKEIIKLKFETPENCNKILNKMKIDNYNNIEGLTETGILFRKHKNIIKFSNDWTDCINICRRDQVSFDYLLFKHNIEYTRYSNTAQLKLINIYQHINPVNKYIQ